MANNNHNNNNNNDLNQIHSFEDACQTALHSSSSSSLNALLALRNFCNEQNILKLFDHLSNSASYPFSTTVLVKAIQFIIASKFSLSRESKNRYIDFENDFFFAANINNNINYSNNSSLSSSGIINRGFYYSGNNKLPDFHENDSDSLNVDFLASLRTHQMSSSGTGGPEVLTRADATSVSETERLLSEHLLRIGQQEAHDQGNNGNHWGNFHLNALQNERPFSSHPAASQYMSLCSFMTFCLYKEYTIQMSTQFSTPVSHFFKKEMRSSSNNNNNNNNNNNQTNDDPRNRLIHLLFGSNQPSLGAVNANYIHNEAEESWRHNLICDLYDDLRRSGSPLFALWGTTKVRSSSLTELICKMKGLLPHYFIKELINDFEDQPKTSPWDTYRSRLNFLTPLFVICRNTLLTLFDLELGHAFPQPTNCGCHSVPSNSALPFPLTDPSIRRDLYCGAPGLQHLNYALRNFSEFFNFISKHTTMFLPETATEESLRIPKNWTGFCFSVFWYLRNFCLHLISENEDNDQSTTSSSAFLLRSYFLGGGNNNNNNNSNNNHENSDDNNYRFETLQQIFSLVGKFSTLSYDSFNEMFLSGGGEQVSETIRSLNNSNNRIAPNARDPMLCYPDDHPVILKLLNDVKVYRVAHDDEEYNNNNNNKNEPEIRSSTIWRNPKNHVAMMLQCATSLLNFAIQANRASFSRNSNHSLRFGSEAFETAGRILANLAERFPETCAMLMASDELKLVPSPEALDELAQFCVGAGKYSMMFSEQALRHFLVFASGISFQIGKFQDQFSSNKSNNNNNNNNNNNRDIETRRIEHLMTNQRIQNLQGIMDKLNELIVNSVGTIFEYIYVENKSSFFVSTTGNSGSSSSFDGNASTNDHHFLIDSTSESLLHLIGSLLIRKSGDGFFLIRHLTNLFDTSSGFFLSSNPDEWAGSNNIQNLFVLPLVIQTVAQSLQACSEAPLSYLSYTNSETIHKELNQLYEESPHQNGKRTRHHPFLNLLFQVCRFSEQIASGSLNSLQSLLESLSLDDSNSKNNDSNDDNDDDENNSRFSSLIPLQYISVIRSMLVLFRVAVKSGVMIRGPFASSCVEFCVFILRSSPSSSLTLRNKAIYEDAIGLLHLLWGSGNEALSLSTCFLPISEKLFSFHLEDRLFLTSTAALSSPSVALSILNISSSNNRDSNHSSSSSSFFSLRQRTLSIFYQRANICAMEKNNVDTRRILNQMLFFTNIHSWSRNSFSFVHDLIPFCSGGNPVKDHQHHNSIHELPSNANFPLNLLEENVIALRCWLKDITSAFRVGKQVMHRNCFVMILMKGVLGLYEEEISDDEENDNSGKHQHRANSSSFWDSVFQTHSKTAVPSFNVLLKQVRLLPCIRKRVIDIHQSQTSHQRSSNHKSNSNIDLEISRQLRSVCSLLIGLLSDFLELIRQITQVAGVTLGKLPPSSQPSFSFLFISQFLVISSRLVNEIQELEESISSLCSSQGNNNIDGGFIQQRLDFQSAPQIIVNLSHSIWSLLVSKVVNLGVLFHYDEIARTAFYDLVSLIADSVSLEDMKQLTSSRDAMAIANVSTLNFCINFESMVQTLESLTNPRGALEDAILIANNNTDETNSDNDDDDDNGRSSSLLDIFVTENNFDLLGENSKSENSNNSNIQNTNRSLNNNSNSISNNTDSFKAPSVLLSKRTDGLGSVSRNQRFFSITRSYASIKASNFVEELQAVIQDHELLASWCRISLGCISFHPERFFYIRTLHCLLGTVPSKSLVKILNSASVTRFTALGSTEGNHHYSSDSHITQVVRNSLSDRFAEQRESTHDEVELSFISPHMTILDDAITILLPLVLTNSLSHLEDAATSAIAIIARIYDCAKRLSADDAEYIPPELEGNGGTTEMIERFEFVSRVILCECLPLENHKARCSEFMDILSGSRSFADAVKQLSELVIQLQPSLTSIFMRKKKTDEKKIQARMAEKIVSSLVPF